MITMKMKKYFIISLLFLIGVSAAWFVYSSNAVTKVIADTLRLDDQEATIRAINKVMPAVVSIIIIDQQSSITINLSTGQKTETKSKVQKGSGTGFIISPDGLILTNKHVVGAANEKTADYRVILNSGKQYYAQLIGKDPINDLAVLKIFDKNLPFVQLGDSDKLQIGTTVVAIGNALGRYQNSATKGIISGLGRNIEASDQSGNLAETLDNVLQTDADINLGNSGGPLVDLAGNVIGINVAMDQTGSAIGFAIPINDAKPVIKSVREIGRIVRPRLGIRYHMLTPEIAGEYKLAKDSGAWISTNETGGPAVLPDSPAAKAGLIPGDIVMEINGIKIQDKTTLLSVVQKYKPGDKIGLRVWRGGKIIILTAVLDEFR
ncbi:MAG: Protease Do [Candidatus Falkowbacteria bacterium GW2011_GWA2_41_14]|uniref:Protease Do n=1 Tax=Candidatus Falkowbacteria bacterium GW2011_GWA2_41_14 TaxID=1618635 RepID=A0A0G0USK2_9BACT|nr:MAG: Protease Do [Candidatus Falkowbacteria bacterium GW2011_GWA2_41_14]